MNSTLPAVNTTNPLPTARGALLTGPLTATFSEALEPSTVNVGSFTLIGPAGAVSGTVSLSADGRVASFIPQATLRYHSDYEARLTTAIRDLAGNALPADHVWRFNAGPRLAAGGRHTCARLDNGAVKCWGGNESGQLGLGDINRRGDGPGEMGDQLPAVDLGASRAAVEVAAGGLHTCARLDNGAVKCWGANDSGQLGLGETDYRGDAPGEMGDALPAVDLGAGRTAEEIAAGELHTCARLDNEEVKCWGHNTFGQLGQGDTSTRGDGPNEMGDLLPAVVIE